MVNTQAQERTREVIDACFTQALSTLVSEYSEVPATIGHDTGFSVEQPIIAAVGFACPSLKGAVSFIASTKVIRALAPSCIGPVDDGDWAGELANQTVGRLKNLVLRCGGPALELAIPTVISGSLLEIRGTGDEHASWTVMAGDLRMEASLRALVAPDLVLTRGPDEAPAPEEDVAAEGTLMLF